MKAGTRHYSISKVDFHGIEQYSTVQYKIVQSKVDSGFLQRKTFVSHQIEKYYL